MPSAVTRPAAMASAARARLSKSPAATRTTSARPAAAAGACAGFTAGPERTAAASPVGACGAPSRSAGRLGDGAGGALGGGLGLAGAAHAERVLDLGDDALRVEARLGVHLLGLVVVDERVG